MAATSSAAPGSVPAPDPSCGPIRLLSPLLLLRHRGPPRSGPPRTASAPPAGEAVHPDPGRSADRRQLDGSLRRFKQQWATTGTARTSAAQPAAGPGRRVAPPTLAIRADDGRGAPGAPAAGPGAGQRGRGRNRRAAGRLPRRGHPAGRGRARAGSRSAPIRAAGAPSPQRRADRSSASGSTWSSAWTPPAVRPAPSTPGSPLPLLIAGWAAGATGARVRIRGELVAVDEPPAALRRARCRAGRRVGRRPGAGRPARARRRGRHPHRARPRATSIGAPPRSTPGWPPRWRTPTGRRWPTWTRSWPASCWPPAGPPGRCWPRPPAARTGGGSCCTPRPRSAWPTTSPSGPAGIAVSPPPAHRGRRADRHRQVRARPRAGRRAGRRGDQRRRHAALPRPGHRHREAAAAERAGVPHHLLDVLDVTETASVAAYQRAARAVVERLRAAGRTPVLVGGSGLYVQAVLDELDFPGTDPALRAELEAELAERGPGAAARPAGRARPGGRRGRAARQRAADRARAGGDRADRPAVPGPAARAGPAAVRRAAARDRPGHRASWTGGSAAGWPGCSPPAWSTRPAGCCAAGLRDGPDRVPGAGLPAGAGRAGRRRRAHRGRGARPSGPPAGSSAGSGPGSAATAGSTGWTAPTRTCSTGPRCR